MCCLWASVNGAREYYLLTSDAAPSIVFPLVFTYLVTRRAYQVDELMGYVSELNQELNVLKNQVCIRLICGSGAWPFCR